jgi:hypothetical protein
VKRRDRFGLGAYRRQHVPDACTCCHKPDTVHILVIVGDLQWYRDVLMVIGFPQEEANQFAPWCFSDMGADPDDRKTKVTVRVCLACAERYEVPVLPVSGVAPDGTPTEVTALVQPDVWPPADATWTG